MPALRALLFDLDDTLHDFLHSERTTQRLCAARLAAELFPTGGPGTEALYQQLVATNTRVLAGWFEEDASATQTMIAYRTRVLRELHRELGAPCDAAGLEALAAWFEAERRRHMRIYPDTLATLRLLRERHPGYRMGLISNGPHDSQRRNAEHFDLLPFFDAVLIEGELGHGKPHARIFHEACAQLGVASAEAVMIGDSLRNDIAGAARAGLRTIWLHRPGDKIQPERREVEPDFTISALAELPATLAQLETVMCEAATA